VTAKKRPRNPFIAALLSSLVPGLVRNPDIVGFLMGEVDKATINLASYEKIKKIVVLEKDFEIGAGELTPTLKVKRGIIENKYRDLIDALYVETAGTDAGKLH
jgi:long-subunit acyl-CoA synthetase (AMP-forming)